MHAAGLKKGMFPPVLNIILNFHCTGPLSGKKIILQMHAEEDDEYDHVNYN